MITVKSSFKIKYNMFLNYLNEELSIITRVYLYSNFEDITEISKTFFSKINFKLLKIHRIQ